MKRNDSIDMAHLENERMKKNKMNMKKRRKKSHKKENRDDEGNCIQHGKRISPLEYLKKESEKNLQLRDSLVPGISFSFC